MKPEVILFGYYGAKTRLAGRYPYPHYDTIIEPFAGSAAYSCKYYNKKVILIERYHVLAEILKYLISADSSEIMNLPIIENDKSVDDYTLTDRQKWLIGFLLSTGKAYPSKRPSAWVKNPAYQNRANLWSNKCRERLSNTVMKIKHWQAIEGSYEMAPDIEATWFIDPPYQVKGKHYKESNKNIEYDRLAEWCKTRKGQVIVCENEGATWLPFRRLCEHKGLHRLPNTEAVWTND